MTLMDAGWQPAVYGSALHLGYNLPKPTPSPGAYGQVVIIRTSLSGNDFGLAFYDPNAFFNITSKTGIIYDNVTITGTELGLPYQIDMPYLGTQNATGDYMYNFTLYRTGNAVIASGSGGNSYGIGDPVLKRGKLR